VLEAGSGPAASSQTSEIVFLGHMIDQKVNYDRVKYVHIRFRLANIHTVRSLASVITELNKCYTFLRGQFQEILCLHFFKFFSSDVHMPP
jgi:hypothetical protein